MQHPDDYKSDTESDYESEQPPEHYYSSMVALPPGGLDTEPLIFGMENNVQERRQNVVNLINRIVALCKDPDVDDNFCERYRRHVVTLKKMYNTLNDSDFDKWYDKVAENLEMVEQQSYAYVEKIERSSYKGNMMQLLREHLRTNRDNADEIQILKSLAADIAAAKTLDELKLIYETIRGRYGNIEHPEDFAAYLLNDLFQ